MMDLRKEIDSMQKTQYIFVRGLSGWVSYDSQYQKFPYREMRNCDLIKVLRDNGFDAHAAITCR